MISSSRSLLSSISLLFLRLRRDGLRGGMVGSEIMHEEKRLHSEENGISCLTDSFLRHYSKEEKGKNKSEIVNEDEIRMEMTLG